MTSPSIKAPAIPEYPADIMKAAEEVLDNLLCNCKESCGGYDGMRLASIKDIAAALLARDERAAKIADAHSLDFEKQAERQNDEAMHDSLLRVADGCELVADAIRNHNTKEA